MSGWSSWLAKTLIILAIAVLIGWPLVITVLEAGNIPQRFSVLLVSLGFDGPARVIQSIWGLGPESASVGSLDPASSSEVISNTGGIARPLRLAGETLLLVAMTELLVLPPGLLLGLLLFRTDLWGRRPLLVLLGMAALVPLPLHATAWLGAMGNAGRMQAIGIQPILVGRVGAAIVHAMAALPWVVFLAGVGFRTVEPELEETAAIEMPLRRVFWSVTVRRSLGAIGAAALAVAILTAGDMTVTDLLQVRTYAEEAYVQFMLGNGPADAAVVSLPPLCVLGGLIFLLGRTLLRDSFKLQTAFHRSKVWPLGRWRFFWGVMVLGFLGNLLAVPFYSLVWRAGRVGGNARLALPPSWSFSGLAGTLRFAATESWEPLKTSILLAVIAATLTVILAWSLAWLARTSRAWQVLLLVLLALTLAVPGPVAGMSLTLGYRWFPLIYDSRIMVVFAQSLRALPYAILILWPAMLSLPRELIESAMVDGLSPPRLVARVGVPLTAFASLVAWCVVLILAVGELPATNIVQPPGTMTITFLIWSLLHTGVESHLTGVALVLLFAFAVLMAIAGLGLSGLLRMRANRG